MVFKPYIGKKFIKGYAKRVRYLPRHEVDNVTLQEHSELLKPYRDNGGYNMMEEMQPNLMKPYETVPPITEDPLKKDRDRVSDDCAGMLMNAFAFPNTLDCGEKTSLLFMGGHDGAGNPWDQATISWEFVVEDCGKLRVFEGRTYFVSPECDGFSTPQLCFGCSANIIGTSPCGFANTIVTVNTGDVEDEVTVSGADLTGVGEDYDATGGVGEISWSISCGTISSSGVVTDLTGCCGTGSITATDSCGNSGSMSVRFPAGSHWEAIETCPPAGEWSCSSGGSGCPACDSCNFSTFFIGVFRYRMRLGCGGTSGKNCCAIWGVSACSAPHCDGSPFCETCWSVSTGVKSEWVCN